MVLHIQLEPGIYSQSVDDDESWMAYIIENNKIIDGPFEFYGEVNEFFSNNFTYGMTHKLLLSPKELPENQTRFLFKLYNKNYIKYGKINCNNKYIENADEIIYSVNQQTLCFCNRKSKKFLKDFDEIYVYEED